MDAHRTKPWKMISGEVDFIEKEQSTNLFVKQKVELQKEEIDFVKELIKTTYTKIQNGEFSEGCNEEQCEWCTFAQTHQLKTRSAFSED